MKTGQSTFRALFGEGRRVEIPVLQRDYAQGRDDERSQDVRARFVKELVSALLRSDAGSPPLDLDFVYGRWKTEQKTLEPLDGQQRLTTLFLVHWYLASIDGGFEELRSWMVHEGRGSCFTYRTRPSARDFFDALVQHPGSADAFRASKSPVSTWAKDREWFVRSWLRDPTVRGCLVMLDALHAALSGTTGLWKRLVSQESPVIVFRLLLLENFNLSDDLYVKMNGRGKALTAFEVFKAELQQFVAASFGAEPCAADPTKSWADHVSLQFDTTWTDFLWKHRGGSVEIDSRFMHLIRALVLVGCLDADDAALPARVERLAGTPQPSLLAYVEMGCLESGVLRAMVHLLDTLSTSPEATAFLGGADYLDETLLFKRVLLALDARQDDGLTLPDWVMFCSWCQFLLRPPVGLGDAAFRSALHDWTRLVANLTRNTDVDRTERLVAALRGVRQLRSLLGADFLSRIADGALDDVGGFNQQQLREETIKARLLLRDAAWRALIERAETHPYFQGDIEFLLRFSGVFERAEASKRCDWSDDEDQVLRASFARWYERACAVFGETATSWPTWFPDRLWERALLTEGDYLLPRGHNWSLLDDNDRDASWKRLLRADTRVHDRKERRDVVRRVLERVDPADAVGSLRKIVADGVQGPDTSPLPGFRSRLVAEPRLIDYCGQRMIRREEETVFLLSRTQRNGRHIDLYIRALALRLQARTAEIAPFDKCLCEDRSAAYPPSQLVLRASVLGVELTVEKHGEGDMQLRIATPAAGAPILASLSGWDPADGGALERKVAVDDAEAVILDLAAALRGKRQDP